MDLRSKIIDTLSAGPLSAREIARRVDTGKTEVNRVLYADTIFVQSSTTPPTWSLASVAKETCEKRIDTIVLLDLNNVHDCLKNLEPYAEVGELLVFAFSEHAYAGYPFTEKSYDMKGIYVSQAKTNSGNAAATMLTWTCCCIANGGLKDIEHITEDTLSPSLEFLIVTKTQGFGYLETLVAAAGHKVKFCKEWNDLRLHI